MRKIGILSIVMILFCVNIPYVPAQQTVQSTIYVDDDNTSGPWDGSLELPFQHIQDGIDASQKGDTIFVFNGTYLENIVISKNVNLQGEESNATIIQGGYQGSVVNIYSDLVSLKGFTIEHVGFSPHEPYPGIFLDNVTQCMIMENIVVTNWNGILIDSSSNCHIFKNVIDKSYEPGIYLQNSHAIILEQNAFGNRSNGLLIQDCTLLEIINNSYCKKGLTLRGKSLEHWNTHTIQDNRKDGQPIYYVKDTDASFIPSNISQIILAHCSNMDIQGIIFHDEATDYDYSDGRIQIGFSSQCTIHNNSISTNSNDISIYLFSCAQINVSNNDIETIYGSAIELDGCMNNSIYGNQIVNNNNGIICLNSHTNKINDNNILDNYHIGISMQFSSGNTIQFNNVNNNFHGGIRIQSSSDTTINDNWIENDIHTSLFLYNASRIRIFNNTFPQMGGVELFNSVNISLTGNNFHSEGIIIIGEFIEHWNTHTIEQNVINGSPIEYYVNTQHSYVSEHAGQIILANVTNIKIQGLQISNVRRPIQIGFSTENLIQKNNFTLCKDCGIYLYNSDNNIISNNRITGNESVAVLTYFSMRNTIRCNTISNNFYGILLYFSEENTIEKNNFQLNMISAEFGCRGFRINSFRMNKWDQNYWDDWIGFGPKVIKGELYPPLMPTGHFWVEFDRHPAKEPYDIEGDL